MADNSQAARTGTPSHSGNRNRRRPVQCGRGSGGRGGSAQAPGLQHSRSARAAPHQAYDLRPLRQAGIPGDPRPPRVPRAGLPAGSLATPGGTPRMPDAARKARVAGHQGKDHRDTDLPVRAGHRRSRPARRSPEPVRPPRARALVGQAHPGDPGQLTDTLLPASVSRRRPPPRPGAGAFAHAPRSCRPRATLARTPGTARPGAGRCRQRALEALRLRRRGQSRGRARNRPLPRSALALKKPPRSQPCPGVAARAWWRGAAC